MRQAWPSCFTYPVHILKAGSILTYAPDIAIRSWSFRYLNAPFTAKGLTKRPCRRGASTSTHNVSVLRHSDGFSYGKSGLPIDLEVLLSPKRQKSSLEWVGVIEAYLPPRLRDDSTGTPRTEEGQTIETLPEVLSRARSQSKVDLLSYFGVYQGRWEAVLWLVTAMMEHFSGNQAITKQSKEHLSLLWLGGEKTIDSLTEDSIYLNAPLSSVPSPESPLDHFEDDASEALRSVGRQALGQVWQSLGTMILQAADRSPEDPEYSMIMTHVFRILAYLHRTSAFPDTIYNYTPAADQSVLRRPPTLHLLSRRIMSTLSDTEFDHHWEAEIIKYGSQGYDLSQNTVRPRIREFGPELWLDLVLWACVEGGWIAEGVWIVGEMEKRRKSRDTRWSTISWQDICATQAPKLDWASILKLQIDRTRLNQVGSIGIATGSDSTVDMGTRTISREVVLALVDGLLNITQSGEGVAQNSYASILQGILACKALTSLSTESLNETILRCLENMGYTAKNASNIVSRMIHLRVAKNKDLANPDSAVTELDSYSDQFSPLLGLFHRILFDAAEQGNLQGSLAILRKLLDAVDQERDRTIRSFVGGLNDETEPKFEPYVNLEVSEQNSDACSLAPRIPTSIMATLMDIMTDNGFYDIGYWLLLNQDVDGGPLSPDLYADRNLQPAVLRFATATANNDILTKILENLQPPLPEAVLHALLPCQIVLGKWSGVEQLLDYLQQTPGMDWHASDVMAVARAVMSLERASSDPMNAEQTSRALGILRGLVHGNYNSKRDLAELPDLTQIRLANQIGRILQSLPGRLGKIDPKPNPGSLRAQTPIHIPSASFKIILDALIEHHGPARGIEFWKMWCHEPSSSRLDTSSRPRREDVDDALLYSDIGNGAEKVVRPTQSMLRSILRPVLGRQDQPLANTTGSGVERIESDRVSSAKHASSIEDSSQVLTSASHSLSTDEQKILEWSIMMYKKFGLSRKQLEREVPRELLDRFKEQ